MTKRPVGNERNAGPLQGVKVLLVEDDADTRDALSFWLESQGALVSTVGSAPEAVEMFRKDPPAIVLSDIGLPGENGYSLMQRLRALGKELGRDIPAAAVTAYTGVEDRQRALRAGFRELIPKPVDVIRLRTLIAGWLAAAGRSDTA